MDRKPALNYESPQSLETIDKIIAYLVGRPLHGATQQEIADMLKVSLQTANRFTQHLVEVKGLIHIAIKAQALGRNSPAIYKHGQPTRTYIPEGCRYRDLPLTFFGGVERRRKKRMSNMNEGKTAVASITRAIMTAWVEIKDADPTRQGAYECKLVGALADDDSEKTHKRWFDGRNWSYPLQPEHEREDGFVKPHDNYFMDGDLTPNFAWRGFVEDQEPL